jgi:hypothetical protein
MTLPHEEFNDTPLAYFITFRTYGTWLHGDKRGSVDRFNNRYGTPRLPPNKLRENYERTLLKRPPVRLNMKQRKVWKSRFAKNVGVANGSFGQQTRARTMFILL